MFPIFINTFRHTFFLGYDLLEIYVTVFLEVAGYESELKIQKFKMADVTWRTKMQRVAWFGWNSLPGVFGDGGLWIWTQNSEIKIGRCNMVDQNWNILLHLDGTRYPGFSETPDHETEFKIQIFIMASVMADKFWSTILNFWILSHNQRLQKLFRIDYHLNCF